MSIFRKRKEANNVTVRKPNTVNRKRAERLSLCLSLEEKKLITEGAEMVGLSRTDFIIAAVRGTKITVISGLPELLIEINRHGTNLNQIAKRLNSHNHVGNAEIAQTCQACQNAYIKLVRFVDQWDMKLKETEERKNDCEDESNKAC